MGSRAHALFVAVIVISSLIGSALPAHAAQVGFQGPSYAGFGGPAGAGAITGQKPESKLWYNAGSWWAAMASSAASGAHRIWKLGASSWTDTGTLIDTHVDTREDVLSLGNTLYILSRASGSGSNKLRRFTYASGTYTLDGGYPVDVPGADKESGVLARDTTGKLWITYTSGSQVFVAHTNGSDSSWSVLVVPVGSSTSVSSDDISSVISFTDATGPAIGVFWSNQNTSTDYFAVHRDNAPNDSTWSLETALTGAHEADDHMNLKTVEGRIYAVVKTSQTKSNSPLIRLLVRDTAGTWTKNPVALVRDGNTRPMTMLQLDPANRRIYVFMSLGEGTAARGIAYRSSPMDGGIAFGSQTTFIQGPGSENINDATSMKANADPTTGIVVLASDGNNYWWNKLGGGAPPNTAPTATAGSATTNEDTAAPVTLSGSDPETCQLTFSIVTAPLHGNLGALGNQNCSSGSPNTDTASVTYTPAANYFGSDSFTFKVNDGIADSPPATVSLTVTGVNDAPIAVASSATTAFNTPASVTVNGSDVDSCQLTFTVVASPSHGILGSPGAVACVPGSPNTDSASILYTPTSGYSGPDSFTFKVNDGNSDSATAATVSLTVSPPGNTAPVASAGSDSTNEDTAKSVTVSGSDAETCELTFTVVTQPAHGSAAAPGAVACGSGGPPYTDSATVLYTPAANYSGPDSFQFKVNDGLADSPLATVSLTVNPVNDLPVASPKSVSTAQDTPVTVTVNGTDVETCELAFSVVTPAAHGNAGAPGAVACAPGAPNSDSATIVYTPAAGYSGPDSFTFKVNDSPADSPAATVSITVTAAGSGIAFRSASGAVNPTATTLVIPAPVGVVAGDVMLAEVAARGNPTLTPPAGWTLVRLDINGNTMRQGVWVKVAGSEPASYTWTLSSSQAASGGILAYSGVNTTTPIDANAGGVSATNSSSIVAPTVTTTVNGTMLVGFFGISINNSIAPPGGMLERYDVVSNAGTYPVATESADALQAVAGASGPRTATAPSAGANIGQLIALRPSGA